MINSKLIRELDCGHGNGCTCTDSLIDEIEQLNVMLENMITTAGEPVLPPRDSRGRFQKLYYPVLKPGKGTT